MYHENFGSGWQLDAATRPVVNGLLGFISLETDSELQTTALCLRWRFRFRTELPMTVTGKPQKFLMRNAMAEERGLVVQKTA
ncbi:hypothetical protein [Mesorhizobium cantuariense]|uniref:Uncharacterized protein n=1 Tax=Mesorhizobium cantuariense TaxID=1300275 RepID=A0ABV7MH76_9HYPH